MNTALLELIPALALFCLISTITPGPNNILLAHSGANFGIRRTLPHVLGIRCGMTLLHIVILLGLGEIFRLWPVMHDVFTFIAAGYIVYMSAKIAFAKMHSSKNSLKPMTILQAASFQAINPKSWASLMSASTLFTLPGDFFGHRRFCVLSRLTSRRDPARLCGSPSASWFQANCKIRPFTATSTC